MSLPSMRNKLVPLSLLVITKLALVLWLYQSGFQAFTADDFGRVIAAADWAQEPYLFRPGPWLPFHMYLTGMVLRLWGNFLIAPRAMALIVSLISIFYMYRLTSILSGNRQVATLASLLLVVNPIHTLLSTAPLTEIYHLTLILGGISFLLDYLNTRATRLLFFSALHFGLANGFRFEAWAFSLVFSMICFHQSVVPNRPFGPNLRLIAAASMPWIFPILWLGANYYETGNAFYALAYTLNYNARWYSPEVDYGQYIESILSIDPFLPLIGPIGLVGFIRSRNRIAVRNAYVLLALLPLVVYVVGQGGRINIITNLIRYLASFAFLFYPMCAWTVRDAFGGSTHKPLTRRLAFWLLLALILFTQSIRTQRFENDPAAQGLSVGQRIRTHLISDPEASSAKALIELTYWEFLAVHTGASDLKQIIYDREFDPLERRSVSILAENSPHAADCISQNNVRVVVLRDPDLRAGFESKIGIGAFEEINGFAFYSVPDSIATLGSKEPCPVNLKFSRQ